MTTAPIIHSFPTSIVCITVEFAPINEDSPTLPCPQIVELGHILKQIKKNYGIHFLNCII